MTDRGAASHKSLDSASAVVASGSEMTVASVVLAGVLFGTAGTVQALGPPGTTPLGVGTARLLIGGLVLVAIMVLQGKTPKAGLRLWRTKAGVLAGGCSAAYQVCFFASVEETGVALGTLVTVGSAPVLAGLLAWLALRQRPDRAWSIATALCVVGLCLLFAEGMTVARPFGVLLGLASGLAAATFNVAAKKLMDEGVAVLDLLTGTFLLGGVLLLPFLVTQPMSWMTTTAGVLVALYLGVATMALANFLMTFGLKRLAPGPVATLILTDPLTATFLGLMVLGETLSASARIGLVLVLIGLLLQGFSSAKRRARAERPEVGLL